MNFSQPNKINSYPPKSLQSHHQQQQNLSSNSFPSYSTPYQYQQPGQNSLTSCHGTNQNQMYGHPRFSGGDLDQSQNPQNFYQPQHTNLARHEHETPSPLRQQRDFMRRSSFEQHQPTIAESNLKSRFYFRSDDYSDDECADPNAKIQHFQYAPRQQQQQMIEETQMMTSFHPSTYIESLPTNFNQGNQEITKLLPKNQKNFLFSRSNDNVVDEETTEEDEKNNERIFRSRTRITSIPNGGFKIITEIYRDKNHQDKVLESEEANSVESMNSAKSLECAKLDEENWFGKSIETTVDGSSCEILTDDADEASENH